MSSSVLVTKAMGKEAEGVPSEKEGICAYCGLIIQKGDLCSKFSPTPAFMDDHSLAGKGSDIFCGYCAPLLSAKGLRESGYGMFSEKDGALPFRKWADIARALENPPTPPFVAVYATANNQHMAWRAPVNLSRDIFYVRVGLRDLKIRRPVLLKAREAAVKIGEYMSVKTTKSSLPHPYAVLSPDLKDANHGLLRFKGNTGKEDKTQQEAREAMPSEFEILDSLTLGETWALRFILSPTAG